MSEELTREEAIRYLKEGKIDEFNDRRSLIHLNLNGIDCNGLNLENADFGDVDLIGAIFEGANLERAIFTRADLSGAIFVNANLDDTDFSWANLSSAKFAGAKIERAIGLPTGLS